MSESNKIEKELNFKVVDKEGLKNYLDINCNPLWTIKIGFDYFDNKMDPRMYARIERVIAQDWWIEKLYLTAKRKIKWEGLVTQRKEITIEIKDKQNIITLLEVLGLSYIDSKWKVRERYEFDGMNVDVDSWYDENFENYVESRIEIEWGEETSIIGFSKKIIQFIEQE